jgi:hypothetical protein
MRPRIQRLPLSSSWCVETWLRFVAWNLELGITGHTRPHIEPCASLTVVACCKLRGAYSRTLSQLPYPSILQVQSIFGEPPGGFVRLSRLQSLLQNCDLLARCRPSACPAPVLALHGDDEKLHCALQRLPLRWWRCLVTAAFSSATRRAPSSAGTFPGAGPSVAGPWPARTIRSWSFQTPLRTHGATHAAAARRLPHLLKPPPACFLALLPNPCGCHCGPD